MSESSAALYLTNEQFAYLQEIAMREGVDSVGTSERKYRQFLSIMTLEGRAVNINPRTVFDTKPNITVIVGDPPKPPLFPSVPTRHQSDQGSASYTVASAGKDATCPDT